jgi:co-chaperonin GroES (HSP10)
MSEFNRSGHITKISGTFRPLHDKVFVTDMEFGEEVTKSGIVLKSDNGKSEGIRPRWARVWAIGPEQKDVHVGEWILIEHSRWTRTVHYEDANGDITEIRMVELDSMIMSSDEKPDDSVDRRVPVGAGSNVNFNIPM